MVVEHTDTNRPFFSVFFICLVLLISFSNSDTATGAEASRPATAEVMADWPDSAEHRRIVAEAEKSVADTAARVAGDRFRPGYHFLPASRFMNDPNGCVQVNGLYHVFFQHLPFWGDKDVPLVPGWGHAVSRDLVHWERWPIALMPLPNTYDAAAVASGCCVIADGQPTIVYTSASPQAQSLARSFDGMRTWRRFARNPVIPKPPAIDGLEEGFRDPFVWREDGRWRMLVGSGIRGRGGTVLLYESEDLLDWKFLNPLSVGMGGDCFQWECPNFFKLGEYWVLVVSPLFHSIPALRGPVQYTIGRYDGRHFEHGDWYFLDLGGPGVFYAPNSLFDDKGRRILWGWLLGGGGPGFPWDGLLTLPRQLELGPDLRLRTWPVAEIESLRAEKLADVSDRELKADEGIDIAKGSQLDMVIELVPWGLGRLDVQLFHSSTNHQSTTVSFDLATGELRCQDKVGLLPRNGSDVCTLRILADRSVIEIYADRREVMSLRTMPAEDAEGLQVAARRAPVRIKSIRAWRMTSVW